MSVAWIYPKQVIIPNLSRVPVNSSKFSDNCFTGEKRVRIKESLLIPQNELNMAQTTIPEFSGEKKENTVQFWLLAKAILK